ncbi:hypothetical protein [Pedobacter sp. BMA]|uniref:hypothetical protein n=1 Tax=Pedobacter sp. BMA TaxID=1663685 RepID=UPI00064989DE|nr:hypothetical protein [Pedobacter sp. BMA]KLT67292.1 hypothetical protein AB669_00795 [Pedobacter sp. BMA]
MKKIIILVTALFLGIAFMAYYYFSKLNNENNAKDLALQSATNNAAMVFSFKNDKSFYEIIGSQHILQQVLGNEKTMYLNTLKESIVRDVTLNSFIQDQPIYISILPDSNKTLNYLLTAQIKPDFKIEKLYSYLKIRRTITEKEKNLYVLKLNDSLNVFLGIHGEVITLSTSINLVKDAAVRLIENPFTAYIKANSQISTNALLTLYINFNKAPLLLTNIIAGNINGELSVFNRQNSFASLNYNFSKEKILFNGSTQIDDRNNYFTLFENTPAQATSIQNILPENTANFTLYAFDNYQNWLKKLISLQSKNQENKKVQATIQKIRNEYRIDLNTVFPAYTKNQFILFQLNTTEKLGAIALTNGEKVKQLLLDASADYNEDVKLFKAPDILFSYFGDPFKKFGRPYYTIIDNYLIVANNASTVQVLLNNYKNNRLLIQTPAYLDAMNQITSTSNVFYYISTKNAADLFRANINLPFYRHLRADSGLKSFDTFCYQMSADKNKFITNLLLNKYLKPPIPDSLSNR